MTSEARRRTREAARRKGAAGVRGRSPRRREAGAVAAIAWPPAVAGLLVGLALALVALVYDPSLFTPYYAPRRVVFYVLVAALPLVLAWSLRGPHRRPSIDLLDVLALAFAAWQLAAALASPAGWLAWVGYYNRGTGAIFWCALALVFICARRLLTTRAAQLVLAGCLSAALMIAAVVAALQAASVSTWWSSAGVIDGRATGTLGNPVHLAAFGLAGVWLAVAAAESARGDRLWRAVLLAGGAAGAVCIVLSVSRAAYLGGLAAAVYLLVTWVRAGRRVLVVALCVTLAVLAAGALVYAAGEGGGGSVWGRLTSVAGGDLTGGDVQRTQLWREGASAVAHRPVSGYGPGAFVVADRLFGRASDEARHPWALASDAHSLPVELAATGGLVSLLLAVALVVAGVWSGRLGTGDGEEKPKQAGLPLTGSPARAYLLAALVYLLVSPLDLVVLAPVAVAAALLCPPRREGRFVWSAGRGDGVRALRAITIALAVAGVILVAGALWAGQRAWRADQAFFDTAQTRTWQGAARASELAPWEAFYALEAGARRWRSGLEAADAAAIAQGKAELEKGVAADPTAADGYADLARLAIAQGELEEAVAQLREGLRWHPHQPVLQGLWAVAAVTAQSEDPQLAGRIARALEQLPPDAPDAWYWLAAYRQASGDAAGAREARDEAARLAPTFTKARYKQRLLHSR
jgi:O-antigen ligase/tetratricopeptide (TPR) repeat protein